MLRGCGAAGMVLVMKTDTVMGNVMGLVAGMGLVIGVGLAVTVGMAMAYEMAQTVPCCPCQLCPLPPLCLTPHWG